MDQPFYNWMYASNRPFFPPVYPYGSGGGYYAASPAAQAQTTLPPALPNPYPQGVATPAIQSQNSTLPLLPAGDRSRSQSRGICDRLSRSRRSRSQPATTAASTRPKREPTASPHVKFSAAPPAVFTPRDSDSDSDAWSTQATVHRERGRDRERRREDEPRHSSSHRRRRARSTSYYQGYAPATPAWSYTQWAPQATNAYPATSYYPASVQPPVAVSYPSSYPPQSAPYTTGYPQAGYCGYPTQYWPYR